MQKYMVTIEAALKALPMYSEVHCNPIHLKDCAIWRSAIRAARFRTNTATVKEAKPATTDVMKRVLQSEPDEVMQLFLHLTWITAARSGDTMSLRKSHLQWGTEDKLAVTYMEGKGAHFRGPYTVHVVLDPKMAARLKELTRTLEAKDKLFPLNTQARSLISLRREDPELESKSMRRGALQTMAKAGVPENTLREFSGHTNNTTLRRYLSWGRTEGVTSTATRKAGEALKNLLTTIKGPHVGRVSGGDGS
jgi:integrase